MKMKTGIIFDIKRYTINDGPGIRTTVYFQGCAASCWWCHNPESKDFGEKIEKSIEKFVDGCVFEKELGKSKEVSVEQLMREIEKDTIFYDTSGGGVTFSGGEPLMQPEFLSLVLGKCKEKYIHTAIDTSGYAPAKVFDSILNKPSLFLYDLKLMNDEESIKYTGISNKLILENLEKLAEKKKKVILRFPIIPGITDSASNIKQIKEFVAPLKVVEEIDILPYHRIAEEKYKKLGLEYKMRGVMPPSDEKIQSLKKEFEDYGFKVKIGG